MKIVNLIEVLCLGALLLLFGVTSFVVVAEGGNAYEKILDKRETTSDLRVSLSFLTTRVRQSDEEGRVSVRSTEYGDMLVISESWGDETRILLYNGYLIEMLAAPSDAVDPMLGERIAMLDGFSAVVGDDGLLVFTTERGGSVRSVSLVLRSEASP